MGKIWSILYYCMMILYCIVVKYQLISALCKTVNISHFMFGLDRAIQNMPHFNA